MTLIRKWFKQFPLKQVLIGSGIAVAVPSLIIVMLIALAFDLSTRGWIIGIVLSIVLPGIITPFIAYHFYKLFEELDDAQNKVQRLNRIDALTGTYVHTYLIELLKRELMLAERHQLPLALMMLDIDQYKSVLERYGQKFSNNVLLTIAAIIKEQLRGSDLIGHYREDIFIAILPHTSREGAYDVAERIRKIVNDKEFKKGDELVELTLSIGIKTVHQDYEDLNRIVSGAGKALKNAIASGRNQVAMSDPS